MNGKKAKRIRKETYGILSLKMPRRYIFEHGTLTATGLRRAYQVAKKAAK